MNELFLLKWEAHPSPVISDVTAHFKAEWHSVRLRNWCRGHAHNCVINTNGLEATSKVVKDDLTD